MTDRVGDVGDAVCALDVVEVPARVFFGDELPAENAVLSEVHVGVKNAGAYLRSEKVA
jgi:hypothetical protein